MERLSDHPKLGGYGELLLRNRTGWPDWPPGADDRPFFDTYLEDRGRQPCLAARHRHLFHYLDYVFAPRRGFRTIGFKLMYDEAFPYPELLYYLRRRHVGIVHLVRRNILDIALSQIGLQSRQRSHAWSAEEREDIRISVNIRYMMRALSRLDRERRIARAILRAAGLAVYHVAYEDLVRDDSFLRNVLFFLDLPGSNDLQLSSKMLKLAPLSHRDGVANFAEVQAALRGTRFEKYLRLG